MCYFIDNPPKGDVLCHFLGCGGASVPAAFLEGVSKTIVAKFEKIYQNKRRGA
jgi:hypothetical protein